MDTDLAVAVVGFVGVVLTAMIGAQNVRIGRIRRDAQSTREQLENDHASDPTKTTNIREDMDNKHDQIVTMLRRDVGGIREDIRLLRRDLSGTQDRVHELETTQERKP